MRQLNKIIQQERHNMNKLMTGIAISTVVIGAVACGPVKSGPSQACITALNHSDEILSLTGQGISVAGQLVDSSVYEAPSLLSEMNNINQKMEEPVSTFKSSYAECKTQGSTPPCDNAFAQEKILLGIATEVLDLVNKYVKGSISSSYMQAQLEPLVPETQSARSQYDTYSSQCRASIV